jgi:hypothetical protein
MRTGFIKVATACWAISILLGGIARAQTYTVLTLQQNACAIGFNNQFQVLATEIGDVVIWDRTGRRSTGIDPRVFSNRLRLNDAGAIAAIANEQLFVWANGATTFLPIPTDRIGIPSSVRKFTSSGIILFETTPGVRWAFDVRSSQLFDLRALTGAFIADINPDGLMGGSSPGGGPYLRFPDGRTAVPWPEDVAVDRVGPSGHFAGGNNLLREAAVLLYGRPDGSVTRIPLGGQGIVAVFDINRRGDVLGEILPLFGLPRSFVYTDGRLLQPPGVPIAMNDAGYMAGNPDIGSCSRLDVFIPRVTAPAGVSVSIAGPTVTLNWQETYGALDYVLEAGSFAGAANLFVGSIGQRTTFTATVPPGRYYVRLRARNDAGAGPASEEVIVDVP